MNNKVSDLPVLVAGGGIGGLAAALALVRQGFQVQVFEQAPEIGEIGAGIQLGPNAFHALDALGVGEKARSRAVFTDYMVMHDAVDAKRIGADGVKSVVRAKYVNDPPRVTGHVVYRAVVDKSEFPDELKWNAASLWAGPNCHLVHYPLRGGEQYNIVVTFHSREQEEWGVKDGSKEEVESYFQGIDPKARQLIELPKTWKRWATADREPVPQWTFGRATLLGDAAHPTTQYMAQGACMALEDAVTLGEALRVHNQDWDAALDHYQRSRIPRTGRIVLSGREMGRLYHAKGVERLIRNDLWKGRTPERFYDAIEWLYGWNVTNCLAQD